MIKLLLTPGINRLVGDYMIYRKSLINLGNVIGRKIDGKQATRYKILS